MNIVRASAAVLVFVSMMNAGAQSIYKWVDEDGVTHFSEQRPQGIEAERIAVRVQSGSSRQSAPESAAPAASAARRPEQKEPATEDRSAAAADKEIRSENCAKARERLETYETSRRLYRQLDDGDREYLDDDELDDARAEARRLVAQWCD